MDFQNSPPFERSACFYVTISESFKRFQYCNFETNFLETKTFSKKNWSTAFQLKPLPEANVKANRMATTKWIYLKEWSFASNYLIFFENLFQFQNLLKRVNLMNQRPNVNIRVFRKRWSLILGCFFPVSILNECIINVFI